MILACDPSLTAFGWVAEDLDGILHGGCIRTKRETKKRRIYVGDDDVRRMELILRELEGLRARIDEELELVVAEQPAGSQSAVASKAGGMVIGLLVGTFFQDAEIRWVQARDVKRAFTHDPGASKQRMVEEALGRPEFARLVEAQKNNPSREAVADACAVMVMARSMRRKVRA